MKMITEEDKQFSWDDVYGLLGGVIEFLHYLKRRKQGKKPFGAIFFSILFALFGIGYIIKALALIQ